MTKLMEWLTVIGVFASLWIHMLVNKFGSVFLAENRTLILFLPLILLIIFGLYAATVVLYRVFTFNDCEEAATELKKEIVEAKADLAKLGFVFKENKKEL